MLRGKKKKRKWIEVAEEMEALERLEGGRTLRESWRARETEGEKANGRSGRSESGVYF